MHNEQSVALKLAIFAGETLVNRQTTMERIVKIGGGVSATVKLDDDGINSMHAVIEVNRVDDVMLVDLGSATGTLVNGKRISKHQLSPGDEIQIGAQRVIVEDIAHAAIERASKAVPALANPFENANGDSAFDMGGAVPAAAYRLIDNPDYVSPHVDTDANAVEVQVRWGGNVLHVAHLAADQSFTVGERADAGKVDFVVPEGKLGAQSLKLVHQGRALFSPGIAATITRSGKSAQSVTEAVAAGLLESGASGHAMPLASETTVKFQFGDVIIELRGVKQARKVGAVWSMAALASGALAYVVGSGIGHAGLLAAMAAFMPPLGATQNDDPTDEQRYLMTQYLDASAESERTDDESMDTVNDTAIEQSGGTGTAAKGEMGKMGSQTSKNTDGRYGIQGNSDTPRLAKQAALRDAAEFGMIGLLNNGMGSTNEPIAIWGGETSEGADPLSANGNMWGSQIGEAAGPGGLGLTGVGSGAGGPGEGIGLGNMGYLGHGDGNGCIGCSGFGDGNGTSIGRLGRKHKTKAPPFRTGDMKTGGRLPPEVIRRVVHSNFGRFRVCYQSALRTNPNLTGRVSVRFVIGRNGTVSSVSGSSNMSDPSVASCVTRAFYSLTFPAPENGVVTVSYPIVFSPTN